MEDRTRRKGLADASANPVVSTEACARAASPAHGLAVRLRQRLLRRGDVDFWGGAGDGPIWASLSFADWVIVARRAEPGRRARRVLERVGA
jgi:hypothetical protein